MDLKEFKEKFEYKQVVEQPNAIAQNPLVSVCVQTYQHANFIGECLDSILMQKTNFNYEILLGEDASSDGTREICKEYAEKYPDKIRLFLHHRENNIAIGGSPTGRFNFAYNLLSAQGKYLALCEGDDFWYDENKLQTQIEFLEKKKDFVLSFHNVDVINERSEIVSTNKLKPAEIKDLSKIELLKGARVPTLAAVFLKIDVIKDIPIQFMKVFNADTFLFALLGESGKGHCHTNITNGRYRITSQGIWAGSTKINKLKRSYNTYKFLQEVIGLKYKKLIFRKVVTRLEILVLFCYQTRDDTNFQIYYKEFLTLSKNSKIAFFRFLFLNIKLIKTKIRR